MTIDVARRHAAKSIRRVGNFIVVFEQSEDIRDSRLNIMKMMRTSNSLRSLPEHVLYQIEEA